MERGAYWYATVADMTGTGIRRPVSLSLYRATERSRTG